MIYDFFAELEATRGKKRCAVETALSGYEIDKCISLRPL
jgi:hypothetical protein